jgi:hypothetical protein
MTRWANIPPKQPIIPIKRLNEGVEVEFLMLFVNLREILTNKAKDKTIMFVK